MLPTISNTYRETGRLAVALLADHRRQGQPHCREHWLSIYPQLNHLLRWADQPGLTTPALRSVLMTIVPGYDDAPKFRCYSEDPALPLLQPSLDALAGIQDRLAATSARIHGEFLVLWATLCDELVGLLRWGYRDRHTSPNLRAEIADLLGLDAPTPDAA